ncbi:hypothetical protein [Sulfitobacter sp.]|uniref:hypothetical protein n=1 Tax=Sulfitobacter sp. TaxID=1903071 RepID=UPI003F6A5835
MKHFLVCIQIITIIRGNILENIFYKFQAANSNQKEVPLRDHENRRVGHGKRFAILSASVADTTDLAWCQHTLAFIANQRFGGLSVTMSVRRQAKARGLSEEMTSAVKDPIAMLPNPSLKPAVRLIDGAEIAMNGQVLH